MDRVYKLQLDQHLNKKSHYMLNVNIELYRLCYKFKRRPSNGTSVASYHRILF